MSYKTSRELKPSARRSKRCARLAAKIEILGSDIAFAKKTRSGTAPG